MSPSLNSYSQKDLEISKSSGCIEWYFLGVNVGSLDLCRAPGFYGTFMCYFRKEGKQ